VNVVEINENKGEIKGYSNCSAKERISRRGTRRGMSKLGGSSGGPGKGFKWIWSSSLGKRKKGKRFWVNIGLWE